MKFNVRALAITCGVLWGGLALLVGLANWLWPGYGTTFLQLLASIYPGYDASASLSGVIIGTLYALVDGLIGGLVFGWLYNRLTG